MTKESITFFWFRRDLRLEDNCGLYYALSNSERVIPLFIFDTTILSKLEEPKDGRVEFIHLQIAALKEKLTKLGSDLLIETGDPIQVWEKLIREYKIKSVYVNKDYEPGAINRDKRINELLNTHSAQLFLFKDQVIFEENEVSKFDGKNYTVFTPYYNSWFGKLKTDESAYLKNYNSSRYYSNFKKGIQSRMPSLQELGFQKTGMSFPDSNFKIEIINRYKQKRDFPSLNSTSRLGIHLRFGTISIRKLVRLALNEELTFLKELVWREFYMQILWANPHLVDKCFRPKYELIQWRNNEMEFERWCKGMTGYPFVDAGMRELNETGFMHNRARMITASFLTKHLLIDWRWGEAYFASKLLDFELASNNGGWQWAAGCGTDAAPYFRIFNPITQQKKFDSDGKYVRKWIPELDSLQYPNPIVDHKFARERCLNTFKEALK